MHAESMLFIDDREAQVTENDLVLEEGVRSNGQCRLPLPQALKATAPFCGCTAAGKKIRVKAGRPGQREEGLVMLACKDLCRGHEGCLMPGLHSRQHGEEGNEGLAAADIALQEAQHAVRGGHIRLDLLEGCGLGGRQAEGKTVEGRCDVTPVSCLRSAAKE